MAEETTAIAKYRYMGEGVDWLHDLCSPGRCMYLYPFTVFADRMGLHRIAEITWY